MGDQARAGGRSHKWFALHFNVVGSSSGRSDGVTDLVNDSVPDVVVQLDVLALTAGAIKELHLTGITVYCTGTT